jgi:regulator of replication initiation timing
MTEYFYHDISRIREYEIEEALAEKLADGWELHRPIMPITKTAGQWGDTKKWISPNTYKGSYLTQKFICTVRKEKSKLKKSEAKKRIGEINRSQSELIDELYNELEKAQSEYRKTLVRVNNLKKNIKEKSCAIEENRKLRNTNHQLTKRVAELEVKVNELTNKLASNQSENATGVYPAVARTGKRWMLLGVYKTQEEARQREIEANRHLA